VWKVEKATTKTSRATSKREQGFSLIEILIVVGLIALATTIFIPSLTGAFRTSTDAFARQTALVLGQARDRAMLTDKLIRLRIDLDKQVMSLDEASSSYLVPKAPDGPLSEREKEELEKKEAAVYQPVKEIMAEPRALPKELRIVQVSTPRLKKPVTEGLVDIYFFNNGHTDGATIYLKSSEDVYNAIVLHPITGLSRLEQKRPEGM
jgi:general secretion pathway protein H